MDLKQYCTGNVTCTNMTCFVASSVIHSLHQSSGTKSMKDFMLCFKVTVIVCFEAIFFLPYVNQAICWSTQFCINSQEQSQKLFKNNLRRGKTQQQQNPMLKCCVYNMEFSPEGNQNAKKNKNPHSTYFKQTCALNIIYMCVTTRCLCIIKAPQKMCTARHPTVN